MNDLSVFILRSRVIGRNLDLVQGAGGNTSVKLDSRYMAIKSSGSLLRQMSSKHGYVRVNRSILEPLLDQAAKLPDPVASENYFHSSLAKAVVGKTNEKPSMETVMHIFLPKHVVHTHSIYANVLTCMEEGESILKRLIGSQAIFVPYVTPGFELALAMRSLAKRVNRKSYTIFLLNHGVICADEDPNVAYGRMIKINQICQQYILKRLPHWSAFKLPQLKKIKINGIDLYQSNNPIIADYLAQFKSSDEISKRCCFPDSVVFCARDLAIMPDQLSLNDATKSINIVPSQGIFYKGERKGVDAIRSIFEAVTYIQATIEALGETLRPLTEKQQITLLTLDSEKYRMRRKS